MENLLLGWIIDGSTKPSEDVDSSAERKPQEILGGAKETRSGGTRASVFSHSFGLDDADSLADFYFGPLFFQLHFPFTTREKEGGMHVGLFKDGKQLE